MAPVMMCWYNPSPAWKSGQDLDPTTAQPLKIGPNEAPVLVDKSHGNQFRLDGTDSSSRDDKTEKELVEENFMNVNPEHLQIGDINAELCTHVIYNYGVLRKDFRVMFKSGDNYLDENRTEGKITVPLRVSCREASSLCLSNLLQVIHYYYYLL